MNVNGKYLKDESGNIISPIVSTSTVFDNKGNSLNNDAYFYSVLNTNQSFTNNQIQLINFTSIDDSENINLSNRVFTVNKSGIYLINLYCHYGPSQRDINFRLLIECYISNNKQSYSLEEYRGDDNEGGIERNDTSKLMTWVIKLQQNSNISFKVTSIGTDGTLYGLNASTPKTSYVFIKKMGNI